MRTFFLRGLLLSFGLACMATTALAQGDAYGTPTLLPLPDPTTPNYGTNWSAAMANSPYRASVARMSQPAMPTPTALTQSMPQGGADGGCTTCGGDSDNCGCDACCEDNCCGLWFGGISGIWMARNNPNKFWTTFETNNNANQLLNTENALGNYKAGGEITVGRWFCGGCACGPRYGIEASYFTIDPFEGFASIRDPNNLLSTPIDVGFVTITNGAPGSPNPASAFFDNAREHRIWRSDELQNIELSLINQRNLYGAGHFQMTWLAGVRFLRFDENLTFGSVQGGFDFGSQGGIHEAYLSSSARNDLFGFQLGVRGEYYLWPRLSVFLAPKIGLMGNNMSVRNQLYTGDGVMQFDITGEKTDFSFLGQLDTGFAFQFAPRWRAFAGYRVIGVTGVALADNQFLPFLADAAGFADVKSNGDLVLHGGFAGLEFNY